MRLASFGHALAVILLLPAAAAAQGVPLPPPPGNGRGPDGGPRISIRVGTGTWEDKRLESFDADVAAGLSFDWSPAAHQSLRLEAGADRAHRSYAGAGPSSASVVESRWSGAASWGYELLHHLVQGRSTLEGVVGVGYLYFDGPVARGGALPVGLGLRLSRPLSESVEARLELFHGLAASAQDPGSASVFGKLQGQTRTALVAGWRLPAGRVEVGYRGEILTYQRDYRLLHSLGLQLGFAL
jgi:hypothetical protein